MVADARAVKLGKRAVDAGWRLEHSSAGYRMVDNATDTLVAADWTSPDGYGLDLDLIEAVLDGTYTYAEPDPPGQVTVTAAAEAAQELTIAEMDDVLPPAVRKLTRAARRHT